jgi:hypothetical protein
MARRLRRLNLIHRLVTPPSHAARRRIDRVRRRVTRIPLHMPKHITFRRQFDPSGNGNTR